MTVPKFHFITLELLPCDNYRPVTICWQYSEVITISDKHCSHKNHYLIDGHPCFNKRFVSHNHRSICCIVCLHPSKKHFISILLARCLSRTSISVGTSASFRVHNIMKKNQARKNDNMVDTQSL